MRSPPLPAGCRVKGCRLQSLSVVELRNRHRPSLSVAQIAARGGRASDAREVMSER